jgi:hypothetical protein
VLAATAFLAIPVLDDVEIAIVVVDVIDLLVITIANRTAAAPR